MHSVLNYRKKIIKNLVAIPKSIMQNNDPEYVRLVTQISEMWEKAREDYST